jgi:hypothetical protein
MEEVWPFTERGMPRYELELIQEHDDLILLLPGGQVNQNGYQMHISIAGVVYNGINMY